MTPPRARSALVALTAALTLGSARAAPEEPRTPALRRLVLVAGENDGGPMRPRLRYAGSDAERLALVLRQLGGVAPEDLVVLRDPGEAALRAALAELSARARRARAGGRVEVLFYYSGHSDEEGLLLRGSRVSYPELRRWLDALGADVRIAILDSCASGALTRGKGGALVAPFLLDTSTRLTGHAILTSSAADEASQESDRIGASFFTHYLLTGLRGAADANQDGKVSLSELYQFAFQETLARTEKTRSGPQHPEWDIELTGTGEVVLTDLRGSAASLVLPAPASGRYFVRDSEGRLVAELRKVPGRPVELGLDPGAYRVTREAAGGVAEAAVQLATGSHVDLGALAFATQSREATALRGDVEPKELVRVPIDLAIFPPVSLVGDRRVETNLQLGLIASRTTRLRGVGIAPVLWADEDVRGVQAGYVGNSARGAVVGAQLSTVANVAGSLRGAQVTNVFNLVREESVGLQATTVVNWSSAPFKGVQASAVVNYASRIRGLQVSAVTNVADQVGGAQIGIVNVGGDVDGTQIGIVNVARSVKGSQVGLVNVASRMDGLPIGLFSWVRDGDHKLQIVGSESGILSAELLLGSKTFHSLLIVGAQQTATGERDWVGLGLGAHLARGAYFFDPAAIAQSSGQEETGHVLATLRLLGGWQFSRWGALVAGPSANFFWSSDAAFDPGVGGALGGRLGSSETGPRRAWLGVQAGLRLGL
jgi:hypothetical protein